MKNPMESIERGVLVVLEGPDGTGKSTVAAELKKRLEESGHPAELLAFPTREGPIGKLIRKWLAGEVQMREEALLYLYVADGVDHEEVVLDWLKRGKVVILDRHPVFGSAVAYQTRTHSISRVLQIASPETSILPDVMFILDVPADVAAERMKGHQPDLFDDLAFNRESYDSLRLRYAAFQIMYGGSLLDARRPVKDMVAEIMANIALFVEDRQKKEAHDG